MKKKSPPFSKPCGRRPISLVLAVLTIFALGRLSPRVAAGQDAPWTSSWRAGTAALSIVMDPRDPAILFASTQTGILKTVDGGLTWSSQPAGPQGAVALAIDPTNSLSVYAGTLNGIEHSTDGGAHFASLPGLHTGVTAIQIDPLQPATMYAVAGNVMKSTNAGIDWVQSANELLTAHVASLLLDRSGYFSLPAFTGDADFPEVFVKMVDATSVFGDFWLFHTGLTDLTYTLTVDDSVTGATRTYEKPGGDYCGGADTRVTRP